MTRKRWLTHAAAALALLAGAPAAAAAATDDGPNPAQIRVVNNFVATVRVYAEDAEGHVHALGRVARGQLKEFAVPDEVARLGPFRLRVYPSEPIGAWVTDETGIKTQPLMLPGDAAVTVWLETDLADSMVEVRTS